MTVHNKNIKSQILLLKLQYVTLFDKSLKPKIVDSNFN